MLVQEGFGVVVIKEVSLMLECASSCLDIFCPALYHLVLGVMARDPGNKKILKCHTYSHSTFSALRGGGGVLKRGVLETPKFEFAAGVIKPYKPWGLPHLEPPCRTARGSHFKFFY